MVSYSYLYSGGFEVGLVFMFGAGEWLLVSVSILRILVICMVFGCF
jgi:hypothetical protein